MLQVPNILRKPIIMVPPTIASIILAPIATVWLGMTNNTAGAGMGTSGLVGQIMTFETMGFTGNVFWAVLILHIIAPAIISLGIASLFKKWQWVKPGDMKIEYE